jgi:hypothetical protein
MASNNAFLPSPAAASAISSPAKFAAGRAVEVGLARASSVDSDDATAERGGFNPSAFADGDDDDVSTPESETRRHTIIATSVAIAPTSA